jgi:glycosyltransferase involved in cell wall biosynthesis
MKITQVARRFTEKAWGGTETVILETSRRLLADGHETQVLCPAALDSCGPDEIGGLGVERVPYFYPYLGLSPEGRRALDLKGGNMFSFALWRRLMTAPAPDLFHLHTGKRIGGIVRTVARRRGVPYVVSIHGGYSDVPDEERSAWTEPTRGTFEWGKALGWWVGSRRVLEDAAAVLCVGENEADRLREALPSGNVVHLPNGVDPQRFRSGDGDAFRRRHGIPEGRRIVLNVARIDPQKNQRFAVEAFARLKATDPDAHLVLVGHVTNPGYRSLVDEEVRKRGLGSRVTLIPGLAPSGGELLGAFHAADVFFLPSLHEPFGITLVEAWATGLPVVASRVGGIPRFVEDGRDGLLFDLGNPAAAAAHLSSVLSNPGLARRLGDVGRAKAKGRFSWDRITGDLASLYAGVIRTHWRARTGACTPVVEGVPCA